VDLRDRQEAYNGFGETLARAFEMVLTPIVCGGIGWLLDRWLGTSPVLTVVLFVLAVTSIAIKTYYGYAAEMKAHEDKLLRRHREPPA
jgi:F0F1-type ATP synthase assembly protein I